jgi:hypothetical protein
MLLWLLLKKVNPKPAKLLQLFRAHAVVGQ